LEPDDLICFIEEVKGLSRLMLLLNSEKLGSSCIFRRPDGGLPDIVALVLLYGIRDFIFFTSA
jgi:hypothetical protein